jgi:hypothetical protein
MTDKRDDDWISATVTDVWSTLRPAAEAKQAAQTMPDWRHRARLHWRAIAVAIAAVLLGIGGTAAAQALLGAPAPPSVKSSIGAVDAGLPADLRLYPDAVNARAVAAGGKAVLYAADLPDGGVCTELAIGARPLGVTCSTRKQRSASAIDVTIPGTPEDDPSLPIVVGGQVNFAADAVQLVADRRQLIPVQVEPAGFFVAALTKDQSLAARRGLRIDVLRAGKVVASRDLSAAFAPEPTRRDPIAVEMVSGPDDLTQLRSFYGSVQLKKAVTVRLEFPDGTAMEQPLGRGGRFDFQLPEARSRDFARLPGRLVALDADGRVLASRKVGAVSYWRARERSR